MNKLKTTIAAALCAGLLTACGGGGGGGVGETAPTMIVASAGPSVQVDAGGGLTVAGQASTTRYALTKLQWGLQAKNPTAPAAVITNQDCVTASKNDRTAINNGGQSYISSSWQCDLGVKVGSSKDPQDYTLTLTATDSAGNTTSSSTTLTVRASATPATGPVTVIAGAQQDAFAGSTLPISCIASGGNSPTSNYSWQWRQVSNPDVPVTLANPTARSTSFVAPAVSMPQLVDLECRATDDSGTTGRAVKTVRLMPSSSAEDTLIANAGNAQQAAPGQTVTLSAAATAWFGADGAPKQGPVLSYYWSQLSGPTVQLMNSTTAMTSFMVPPEVRERTTYTFAVAAFGGQKAASTAEVTVIADPAATLNLALLNPAKAVSRGEAVTLWATSNAAATSAVYYSWTQVGGPPVPLGGALTPNLGFVVPLDAPLGTQYAFRVSAGFKPISANYPGIQSQDVVLTVTK